MNVNKQVVIIRITIKHIIIFCLILIMSYNTLPLLKDVYDEGSRVYISSQEEVEIIKMNKLKLIYLNFTEDCYGHDPQDSKTGLTSFINKIILNYISNLEDGRIILLNPITRYGNLSIWFKFKTCNRTTKFIVNIDYKSNKHKWFDVSQIVLNYHFRPIFITKTTCDTCLIYRTGDKYQEGDLIQIHRIIQPLIYSDFNGIVCVLTDEMTLIEMLTVNNFKLTNLSKKGLIKGGFKNNIMSNLLFNESNNNVIMNKINECVSSHKVIAMTSSNLFILTWQIMNSQNKGFNLFGYKKNSEIISIFS
jgi:hypothetical protein